MQVNWVSWEKVNSAFESQGGGREVVVVPEVSVVLHNAAHQVQEGLALHLASNTL